MVKKQLKPEIPATKKTYQPLLVGFLLSVIAILLAVVLVMQLTFPKKENNKDNKPIQNKSVENADNELINQDDFIADDDIIRNIAIKNSSNQSHPVVAIIDNHFEAWDSQFGLSQAQIVYHTLVEGGTTRFLAVFDVYNANTKVGPIRSIRPYFIPLALEYNALLAHVGGSPQALEDISSLNVNNLNEMTFYGSLYFSRDDYYTAPHNTFSSTIYLEQALEDYGLTNPNHLSISHFAYANNSDKDYKNQTIVIDYSAKKTYDVEYYWNNTHQGYIRYRFGEKQRDSEIGGVILINNVIVQRVPTEEVLDDKLRIAMDVIGEGEAIIFRNGEQTDAVWNKPDVNTPTKFFDKQGREIQFNLGNIWIEIVPEVHDVEVY